MIYDDVLKEYGPYICKDGRLRIILKYKDKKTTVSYPKYLMEKHLNRYLEEDETIDHIDSNPLNNNLNNLRILHRKEHAYNDAIRNAEITVKCSYCSKEFKIKGSSINYRNRKDRNQSGYFCSKECSGKYGASIQNKKLKAEKCEIIKPEKFKLHKFECTDGNI